MKTFAQSYLTRLLERHLLLEPLHLYEVNRGLACALEELRLESAPLEKIASAIEKTDMGSSRAVMNLLGMPLCPLWVRAALQSIKLKLKGQKKADVVIVGLWKALMGPTSRRTEIVEKRFIEWREFVEDQLKGSQVENLTLLWIG